MAGSRLELRREYDDLYRGSGFGDAPRFYDWLCHLAGVSSDSRVLDIGCGAGGALAAVTRYGGRAFGLDFSRSALEHARTAAPDAMLIQGDATRLPFADQSFRVVFQLGNLEHFEDLDAGLAEMRRVLHGDGRAWVLVPNLFYSGAIWRAIRGGGGPDHHQPIDRFATRREWQDLLEVHGLEVVRWRPYHRGKWWKRLFPRELAWHFLFETRRADPVEREALLPLGRSRQTANQRRRK